MILSEEKCPRQSLTVSQFAQRWSVQTTPTTTTGLVCIGAASPSGVFQQISTLLLMEEAEPPSSPGPTPSQSQQSEASWWSQDPGEERRGGAEVLFDSSCGSQCAASGRQGEGGREGGGQVATSITAFCFLLHLSQSLALPPLCSFIASASPSTPRLHTEKKSITLRSECWRRHRLLCPAYWPFPACSVGRRAAGFSARFVSAGHFSHFWTSGDAHARQCRLRQNRRPQTVAGKQWQKCTQAKAREKTEKIMRIKAEKSHFFSSQLKSDDDDL